MRCFTTRAIWSATLFLAASVCVPAATNGCRSRTFDRGPSAPRTRLDPNGKVRPWGLKDGTVGPTRSPDAKLGEIAASRLLLAEDGARAFGLPDAFAVLDGLAAIPLNLGEASPFHLSWPAGAPSLPFLAVWLRFDSAGAERAGLLLEVGDPLVERISAKAKKVVVEIGGEGLGPWTFTTSFVKSALAWRVTLLEDDLLEATLTRPAAYGSVDALPSELISTLSTLASSRLLARVLVDGKGDGDSFPVSFRFPTMSSPKRTAGACDAAPFMKNGGNGLGSRDASKAFVVLPGAGWRGFESGIEASNPRANLANASSVSSFLAALGSRIAGAKEDESPYGAKDIAVFRALRPQEILIVAPGESSWFAVDSTAPDCAKVH